MSTVYVLSGVTSKDNHTTVLGVYSSALKMRESLDYWHEHKTFLSHYFYDVIEIDSLAEWTNEQSAIYPTK